MVDSYNEDDDLRRLKDWWQQNGLALVLGAGVGLAAIGGWQWWRHHVDAQASAAADVYREFQVRLNQGGANGQTLDLAERLKNDYAGTPYAAEAGMALARFYVGNENYSRAVTQLEWVVNYADQPPVRHIARVRQARLLWAQGQADAALALLKHDHPEAFTPLYSELQGDIHAAAGDREQARAAYQKALQHLPPDADRQALERKLGSVAGGDTPAEQAEAS